MCLLPCGFKFEPSSSLCCLMGTPCWHLVLACCVLQALGSMDAEVQDLGFVHICLADGVQVLRHALTKEEVELPQGVSLYMPYIW